MKIFITQHPLYSPGGINHVIPSRRYHGRLMAVIVCTHRIMDLSEHMEEEDYAIDRARKTKFHT